MTMGNTLILSEHCALLAVVELSVMGYFCVSPAKEYELSGKNW